MPDTPAIGPNESELARAMAAALFRGLGTFWAEAYAGRHEIRGFINGQARAYREPARELEGLGDWLAVSKVPGLECRAWHLLSLEQPQRMTARSFDREPAATVFDQIDLSVSYPLPKGMVDFVLATPETHTQRKAWWYDQDVWIDRLTSRIVFRQDPYNDAYVDGVGRRYIWLYRPRFSGYRVYSHSGYLIGRREEDSPAYARFVAEVVACLTQGATELRVRKAIAAAIESRVVETPSTVTDVVSGPFGETVVSTESEVFIIPDGRSSVVTVGDRVQAGDTVSDELEFCDHRTGSPCDDVGVTHRFALDDKVRWLSFSSLPQTVTRPTESSVRFTVGGEPDAVEAYWRAADLSDRLASLIDGEEVVPAELIADLILRYGWTTVKVAAQRLTARKADRLNWVPGPAASARRLLFLGVTSESPVIAGTSTIEMGVGPDIESVAVPSPITTLGDIEFPDGPC